MQLKVTYIEHSGFLVESESAYFLFDYYRGRLPELNPDKPLFSFSSHGHEDHFSQDTIAKVRKHEKACFLLSADISGRRVPDDLRDKVRFLGAGKNTAISLGGASIQIRTFCSTDEGVAFAVRGAGVDLYHAGDLNDWYWEGEPDDWNIGVGERYRREIDALAGIYSGSGGGRTLDAAFVVLDGRQEKAYRLGMDYFLEKVSVKNVFPMHFWGNFGLIQKYKREQTNPVLSRKVRDLSSFGQEILLEDEGSGKH